MKIGVLFILYFAAALTQVSGQEPSSVEDPAALINSFRAAEIDEKIGLLNNLNAQASSPDADAGALEYLQYILLAQESVESRIQIAQRYLLAHEDLNLRETGVDFLIDGVIAGVPAAASKKTQRSLTDLLRRTDSTGLESYRFADKLARALVMMESDVGLDVFLTNSKTIKNYSRKDKWGADSPPEKLQELSLKYQEKFDQSQPNEWDFFWSKFYQLAETRREQGQLLTANDPLIDLESVLDGTFEPKLVAQIETTNETKTLRESAAVKAQPEPAVKEGVQESVPAEPIIKETARVAPIEIIKEAPEESTNWLPWLIGALVVLGGLVMVVRRKN
jgi:hypothetical protein